LLPYGRYISDFVKNVTNAVRNKNLHWSICDRSARTRCILFTKNRIANAKNNYKFSQVYFGYHILFRARFRILINKKLIQAQKCLYGLAFICPALFHSMFHPTYQKLLFFIQFFIFSCLRPKQFIAVRVAVKKILR
jgi:hypothetical protein